MENRKDMLRELFEKTQRMNHLEQMLNHLYNKQNSLECSVHELRLSNNKEQADVTRLEGKTFAAFFYGLIGRKDQKLTAERAEALLAQAKLESAEQELQTVLDRIAEHEAELESLSGCDKQYAALLQEKEQAVKASGKPERAELLRIEGEIAAAELHLKEVREALDAGEAAKKKAKQVLSELNSAEDWGTYDAFGGGMVAGIVKHSHLDSAQKTLWYMRKELENFRTELSDVDIHADLQVSVDDFTQFADIFLDDIFSDWSVLDCISSSKSQVHHVMEQIEQVMRKLRKSKQGLCTALEELNAEHDRLLINIDL